MTVKFDPSSDAVLTGIVSFCSWQNKDFQEAVRRMFHESPRERIVEIQIGRDGIKAKFEMQNSAQ